MRRLRVSCVIPVYNGERFLAEAIDSALGQSHPPEEILVIDDGSTDGTARVAARYGSCISYHRQQNAGPAAARNRGVRSARGDLVAILDADDVWHPEKLARQLARFAERPELGISMTWMRNFWESEVAHEETEYARWSRGSLSIQSLVARRELFEAVGPFDEEAQHKDVIGWVMRARHRGVVFEAIPEVLVDRRVHRSNMSRSRGGEDASELLALARLLIDSRRDHDLHQA